MSRYIDAEKIELRLPTFKDGQGEVYVPLSEVKKCISLTPTEDVAPVVRCKDCSFFREKRNSNGINVGSHCARVNSVITGRINENGELENCETMMWVLPEDFCSKAKRMDGE